MRIMSRKVLHRATIAVVALVLVGLAGGWWWMAVGRYPFAGEIRHDFGEIQILGTSGVKEHVFHLRNRRGETLRIAAIRESCGCTAAEPSTREVAPGETLELLVRLALSHAGEKTSTVSIILDDDTVQTLFIRGLGVRRERLELGATQVLLAPGATQRLTIRFQVQDDDAEPPAPVFVPPPGVNAEFLGWELVKPRDPATRRAAEWRGLFELAFAGDPADAQLTRPFMVSVGEELPKPARVVLDAK